MSPNAELKAALETIRDISEMAAELKFLREEVKELKRERNQWQEAYIACAKARCVPPTSTGKAP